MSARRAAGTVEPGSERPDRTPVSGDPPIEPGAGLRMASAAVALAGLGIAGYLTVVHYAGGTPACAVSQGCATVQESRYAELAGVPVALLGLAGYVAILASLARDGERARTATAFLALAGFGFSGWLTYVELTRLDAICSWCVGSAICMTLLAALSFTRLLAAPPPGRRK
jgi:uncharacterized membrane protein